MAGKPEGARQRCQCVGLIVDDQDIRLHVPR
jgi:hypothetical protein